MGLPPARITIQGAYARIKRQISADTSRPVSTIRAVDDLRAHYEYTEADLRALERSLSRQFTDVAILPIMPEEFTRNPRLSSVRDWVLACWAKIPPRHRCKPR